MASDFESFLFGLGTGAFRAGAKINTDAQQATNDQGVVDDAYAEVLSPEQISADAQTLQDLYRVYGQTPFSGGGQGQF